MKRACLSPRKCLAWNHVDFCLRRWKVRNTNTAFGPKSTKRKSNKKHPPGFLIYPPKKLTYPLFPVGTLESMMIFRLGPVWWDMDEPFPWGVIKLSCLGPGFCQGNLANPCTRRKSYPATRNLAVVVFGGLVAGHPNTLFFNGNATRINVNFPPR